MPEITFGGHSAKRESSPSPSRNPGPSICFQICDSLRHVGQVLTRESGQTPNLNYWGNEDQFLDPGRTCNCYAGRCKGT